MCCNSSDVAAGVNQSCIPIPAGATPCCPGSATSGTSGNSVCQTALGSNATCDVTTFTCTTCEAVALMNPVYTVDPVSGNDGATGSALAAGGTASEACALKTIGRALQLIAVVGTAQPTKIVVVGSAAGVTDTSETFPLTIPSNTTLTTSTGAVTIVVGSAQNGFVLSGASSTISSGTGAALTISGTPTGGMATGLNGIQVSGNAVAASTKISDLTVSGMVQAGILVGGGPGGAAGGSVTIGKGVVLENNTDGLHVTGTGAANITVEAGSTPSFFDSNSQHGILVDTNGAITLAGVPTANTLTTTSPAGTIMTQGNGAAGIWIEQTPGATEVNTINGVVSYANAGGANGMRIVAGSNVTVLNSWFLKNGGNGVIISAGSGGTAAQNDSIANINLGTANGAAFANNVFQQPQTGNANGSSGICLAIPTGHTAFGTISAVAPQALSAAGNQFSLLNCATGTGALQLNPASCDNGTRTAGGANPFVCSNGICDLGLAGGKAPVGTTAQPNTGCTQ
jgi:filamentous hemagglutinin